MATPPGRHQLAILDLNVDLGAALAEHVIATPTFVRNLPLPVRRVAGDLSGVDKVLSALGLDGSPTDRSS